MGNPYLKRITARMQADNAVERLRQHWSARAWWAVNRPAFWLECVGLNRVAQFYLLAIGPLVEWLAHRQRVFLRRWL